MFPRLLQKVFNQAILLKRLIRPFRLHDLSNLENERKELLITIFLSLGGLSTFLFAFINYFNHEYTVIFVDILIFCFCGILLLFMRWRRAYLQGIITTVITVFFIAISLLIAISYHNPYYPISALLTPAVYIFLLGGKRGGLLSLAHPVFLSILYLAFNEYYNFPESFINRIILINIIIIILVGIYEYTRYTIQNALSEHRTMLNTTINKLDLQQREYIKIMQNINDGIFLLDENLQIKIPYSKALKNILSLSFIAEKTSIFDLLEGRIFTSKLIQLKHYLNETLHQRKLPDELPNPVRRITLRCDPPATHESPHAQSQTLPSNHIYEESEKTITLTFTLIHYQHRAPEIMGKVVDISEEVRLQKKLKKQKERNAQKHEAIISITRLHPGDLNTFIRHSDEKISLFTRSIEKYRHHSALRPDILTRLYETFLTHLHTLKGNASVIGYIRFADFIHTCESRLHTFMETTPHGNPDFLANLAHEVSQELYATEDIIDKLGQFNYRYRKLSKKYHQSFYQFFRRAIDFSRKDHHPEITLDMSQFHESLIQKHQSSLPSIQDLKSMLVVLIKNSLTHGIEDRETRKSLSKPSAATIEISTEERNNSRVLALIYSDDGKGLDLKKIETLKNERTTRETEALIFQKHFSTQTHSTLDAGRGMGLYSIKQSLEDIGGTLDWQSIPGKEFSLTLLFPPLS